MQSKKLFSAITLKGIALKLFIWVKFFHRMISSIDSFDRLYLSIKIRAFDKNMCFNKITLN